MLPQYSDRARQAIFRADDVARGFNHQYIGTEHLLLGLIERDAGELAYSLRALGVDPNEIRPRIEQLVQPGRQSSSQGKLPFTPRAQRAIELSQQDADFLQQDRIEPEHLLVGLIREQEGVAGQVLLGLGLQSDTAAKCLFRHRLRQMQFVERVVRPVHAGIARKRKMRDELLAHLSAIYYEELSQRRDPDAALQAAARRFGEPAELTGELQNSLPLHERLSYLVERHIGWRPPETATRWMARCAFQVAGLLAVLNVFAVIWMVTALGWNVGAWLAIRAIGSLSLLVPVVMLILGVSYFQLRDASFGAFGSRKSTLRVATLSASMGLALAAALAAFVLLAYGRIVDRNELIQIAVAALFAPSYLLLVARHNGPTEIRDTLWASLEIDAPQSFGAAPAEPAG